MRASRPSRCSNATGKRLGLSNFAFQDLTATLQARKVHIEPDRLGAVPVPQRFLRSVERSPPLTIRFFVAPSLVSAHPEGGQAIIATEEPPALIFPVEVVFLGGKPFIYTEQDWGEFPDVARAAFMETRTRFLVYWHHLCAGVPILEDGALIGGDLVFYRCLELINGMHRLRPYALLNRQVH